MTDFSRPCRVRNILIIFAALSLSACGLDPFVYDRGRFDRSLSGFGKPLTNRSQVVVCYSTSNTTPQNVISLATEACAEHGKVPVFEEQTYFKCPLLAPVAAIYACENPEQK